jgi:uncharacterized protein
MADFYFERTQFDALWQRIEAGENIIFLGPRRMGKTLMCRHLVRHAQNLGWLAKVIDISGCRDEEHMVRTIESNTADFVSKAKQWLRRTKINIAGVSVEIAALPWEERGQALCADFAAHRKGALLILDEAPILLNNLLKTEHARGARFAQMLRNWRQSAPNLRWLMAGSIGLHTLAQHHKITTTINDLVPFALDALSAAEVPLFLKAYCAHRGITISDTVIAYLMQKITWHVPHHYIELINAICNASASKLLTDTAQIDLGFDALLRQRGSFLDHWNDRLDVHGLAIAKQLRKLLRSIAQHQDGVTLALLGRSDDAQLQHYLNLLEDEGYLARITRDRQMAYVFRSALLRQWWLLQ